MDLPFPIESYSSIQPTWPSEGKHILASYDDSSILVYQAYKPTIAEWAVNHKTFLGCTDFSLSRMTWIKTNFLWMMYRCGWASKKDQERVLAIRISREGFEEMLKRARRLPEKDKCDEPSQKNQSKKCESEDTVRLQWDPDHSPNGDKCNRRAIQLGIRGSSLTQLLTHWILDIVDITEFVITQRDALSEENFEILNVPAERVYHLSDQQLHDHLGLDEP